MMRRAALAMAFVAANAAGQAARDPVYVPKDAAVVAMDEAQARRIVTEILQRRAFEGVIVHGPELEAFMRPPWVQSVAFEPGLIVIGHEKGRLEIGLGAGWRAQVITDSVMGLPQYGVPASASDVLWVVDGGFDGDRRKARATQLADALHALLRTVTQAAEADAQLVEVAARYRALPVKPALPEEAHRAKVQADFAIGLKRYADAAGYLAEGIRHAPWWADGRFNRALLLAETGRYRDAVQEMRRYLLLVPEGPDARTAQDRIYQWEAAGNLPPQPPGAAAQPAPLPLFGTNAPAAPAK